jgi:hypothetical protein
MKINEITEQPVSGIKTGLQGLGSRILNRIPGMKATAGNLAARADLGDTARNAYTEFAKWLGSRNKKINQATGDDLKLFFDDAGLDASGIADGPLDKARLNAAMIDAATQISSKTKKTGLAKPQSAPAAIDTTPVQKQKTKSQSVDARKTDSYEKAKSQMRKFTPKQGKPLPDKFLNSIGKDIRKLSKGDKESGVSAAERIIKFSRAGQDVTGLHKRWLQSAKAGERFLTQSVYLAVTNMLREHNLTWSDLGLKVRLTESVNNKKSVLVSQI